MAKTLRTESGEILKFKSPAEFFADNKNIAGFDNPGKSLYTTVREFVENSLDATEAIGVLPEISIKIEEIQKSSFNSLIGLKNRERVNISLYEQAETAKERKAREVREEKERVRLEKLAATGAEDPQAGKKPVGAPGKSRKDTTYYRITVQDNGGGMPYDAIPDMLGRVLAGTKYGVRQTRGKFGLGAKMALIWSKMSTGLPIDIRSAQQRQDFVSVYKLDIDIHRNCPNVIAASKEPNPSGWHGTTMSVIIEGNWTSYRAKVLSYLRALAVITPYAHFDFRYQSETNDKNTLAIRFARRTDYMPPPARTVKHYPSSINLLLIKDLISETKCKTLQEFLSTELAAITRSKAAALIDELGPGFSNNTAPSHLTQEQLVRLIDLLRSALFDPPDGSCLSPAGEYNLRLGIIKELRPDMVATYQEPTRVFEGHPFVVECGVSVGGANVKPGVNVYRFANRIPLLFEGGSDVATRTANRKISWTQYKMRANQDKIGVFVSLVSTKIPFKGTGKEYIGDDATEIADAVKHAIQMCCLQLKSKIAVLQALKDKRERRKNLFKYIPNVSRAIMGLLDVFAGKRTRGEAAAEQSQAKRARVGDIATSTMTTATMVHPEDVVPLVHSNAISEAILARKLTDHVELYDAELAMEFVTSKGGESQNLFIAPMQVEPLTMISGAHFNLGLMPKAFLQPHE